jgi:hypothetical protein
MTEGKERRVSIPILVLSIVCALCIGWIVGFFSFIFYAQYRMGFLFPSHEISLAGEAADDMDSAGDRIVRREILFHKPGSNLLWRDRFEVLDPGPGRIAGRVYVEDRPVAGLKMALLIAPGRRSQIVETDVNGAFEVPILPDRYFLNGFLFYNSEEMLAGTLLVNRLQNYEGRPFNVGDGDYGKTMDTFETLKGQVGPQEAARALADKVLIESRFEFQFEVTNAPVAFPDLHFRKPIAIIAPKGKVSTTKEALKFVWGPHPRAATYRLTLSEITREGTTTRYDPIAAVRGIKEPFIDYPDLIQRSLAQRPENCSDETREIKKGRLYSIRVMAFDKDNQVLTASSEYVSDTSAFSLK